MGRPADAKWFVVELSRSAAEVDATSGALWAAGARGIEERPGSSDPADESVVSLQVAVPADALPAVLEVAGNDAFVHEVTEHETATEWERWAPPVFVGRVVVEPLERRDPIGRDTDATLVRIRAGAAFGWGGHPTTVLALELLQECVHPGVSVLDVGTGTGVLAIAAARLGARNVLAIDIEAEARVAATENVRINEVDGLVTISAEPIAGVTDQYDVVVANIERGVLIDQAHELTGLVATGGSLVISGFLTVHEREVMEAYGELRWRAPRRSGEWSARRGTRR